MTNPVEAERRFLALQQQLSNHLSYRQQWLEIGDFLSLIEGHYKTYDTHCEQLADQMPVFIHPLSVTGTDPSQFEDILGLLSALSESVPSLQHSRNFSEAKEALLVATAFLYLCLQQFESGNRVLFGEQPDAIQEAVDIKDYLDKALAYVQSGATNLASGRIDRLKKWWGLVNEKSSSTLYVPVVEVSGSGEKQGRLRKLTATVLSEKEEKDSFRNSYSVAGAEAVDAGIRREVIEATRHLISESHPEMQQRYFNLQFEYALPLGMHIGRSSELACSLLAYSAILDAVNSRERFIPKPRVAVTGRLEEASGVAPISNEGIAAKARAAFFSWADTLVVPEQQKNRFLEQLAILQEQYPSRKLTLIGLEEPKAFFYDRRISDHNIDSRTKHLAKQAWQQKFSLTGAAIIVVLMAVIGRLWYGPLDRNPVTGVFEGQMLKLYNRSGAEIMSREVGTGRQSYSPQNGSGDRKPQVQLYDISGDGINELFWYQVSNRPELTHNTLRAWSVTGDSLIWELPLNFELNFPRKNSIVNNEYHIDEFHITDNRDGDPIMVVNANLHSFFPTIVFTADAQDGEVKQQYVHVGHFYDLTLADLDKDGVKEIVGTGVNNALWMASLAVLDLGSLQGHGPLEGDYIVEDFKRADELHYILVPKTVVGQYYNPVQKMSYGDRIRFNEGEQLLYVRLKDAGAVDFPGLGGAFIIIYFNTEMKVEGIGTEDRYDILARKLYQENKIPFEPDYEYFEAFKDSLVYVVKN